MHVHQSIWKDGNPAFAGSAYADLSETALYYIGGIVLCWFLIFVFNIMYFVKV